jgi:hypothetical protein
LPGLLRHAPCEHDFHGAKIVTKPLDIWD